MKIEKYTRKDAFERITHAKLGSLSKDHITEEYLRSNMKTNWKEHLGEILSPFIKHDAERQSFIEDLHLWYAPGECYNDVNKMFDETFEQDVAYLKTFWQITLKDLSDELLARVPEKVVNKLGLSYLL